MAEVENEPLQSMVKVSSGKRRVTLQDVALAAGVKVSTVSDALKGTGRVSEATREKVRRVAAEINYVPNLAARALVTGRTGTIAVVCGDLNEYYYATIVHLLEKMLTAEGYKIMLIRTKAEVHDLVTAADAVAVDGIIAVDRYHLVDVFQRTDTKVHGCVFIGTYAPPAVDHVSIDLSEAVEQAFDAMLAQGRRRLAYLVTSEPMASAEEIRTQSYLRFMHREKLQPEIINLRCDGFKVRENLQRYIDSNGYPDGMLCQNDEVAIFAYRGLLDAGLKVPQDVALIGCDGLRHLECFETPISTIRQPLEEVCNYAWSFLKQRMKGASIPLQQVRMKGELVLRESVSG